MRWISAGSSVDEQTKATAPQSTVNAIKRTVWGQAGGVIVKRPEKAHASPDAVHVWPDKGRQTEGLGAKDQSSALYSVLLRAKHTEGLWPAGVPVIPWHYENKILLQQFGCVSFILMSV